MTDRQAWKTVRHTGKQITEIVACGGQTERETERETDRQSVKTERQSYRQRDHTV